MRVRASTLALVGAYIAVCAAILYALHHGGVRLFFALVTRVSGACLAWMLYWLQGRGALTFSHAIVAWLIVNGTCVLWGVLYLAVTGAEQIAETLGRYVVTELLGTVAVALAKNTVENISKNNSWPDKRSDETVKRDL